MAFDIPCPGVQTHEFVASVQRALAARGLYAGPVSGETDTATGTAIRAFQAARGLDSPVLSVAGAQALGLLPYR